MYVERVPNRSSPPAVLLRESYREGGRIKKRTLANLQAAARGRRGRAACSAVNRWSQDVFTRPERPRRRSALHAQARPDPARPARHRAVEAGHGPRPGPRAVSTRRTNSTRRWTWSNARQPSRPGQTELVTTSRPAIWKAPAARWPGAAQPRRQEGLQIVFGLLCTSTGCPVAVEAKARHGPEHGGQSWRSSGSAGLKRVVLVGTGAC